MKEIKIYDTTLRDGSQGEGISFSVMDKVKIAKKLDKFGVHYIEGGWPGSNPKDMEFFKQARKIKFKNSELVAFGSTRRPKINPTEDENLKALIKSGVRLAAIFGKTWDMHVTDILKVSLQENLRMIKDTVEFLKSMNLYVFYDAEHFFDGYMRNKNYALETLHSAVNAGCDAVVLCDTNGGMLTHELGTIVRAISSECSNVILGIHTHNDGGLAVANTLAAVEAGASIAQGTINGYGERCGNGDLCGIIPNLQLKMGYKCCSESKLKELTEVSRYINEISNMRPQDNQPFVGRSAFAHKGGVHINAVMKNPASYEHVIPEKVGNHRRILVSELSGKTSIILKAKEMEFDLTKDDPKTKRILRLIQSMENQGYHFEAADGSFELLVKKELKRYKPFFTLEGFRVSIEKREDDMLISEAIIKLNVNKKEEHTAAIGDGPVNALDNALRKALTKFYPTLSKMHLSDFKVRVLDEKAGTAAKVRVLIQSEDENSSWGTVGVSENIIEASWQALVDSVEYKLLKDKAR
ncbi:MAG: citramalate synthase [Omnitrophica bacterium GWA2_41_15]|nr:MAG: citramalate synthase [Omnitrophica bacterium GWA2_41_15]HAZ10938.1 citramalate synthase [Candidatus Omnitrophota bacterium]